uniref:Uncharacterized protein n=1 Tax=Cacopsylla melanoneura TaxID=428564 RepID=A0A8D8YS97_9HEMI
MTMKRTLHPYLIIAYILVIHWKRLLSLWRTTIRWPTRLILSLILTLFISKIELRIGQTRIVRVNRTSLCYAIVMELKAVVTRRTRFITNAPRTVRIVARR